MQTVSTLLRDSLLNGHTLFTKPQLIAEWNQNRYGGIQTVDNNPSHALTAEYPEEFPIESIVSPVRPSRGITKARTAKPMSTTVFKWNRNPVPYGDEAYTTPSYSDQPGTKRYYTVGKDAAYKYWTSPRKSETGGTFPVGYEVRPYVIYTRMSWVNKVVIALENNWASPNNFTVEYTLDGTTWTVLATNPTISSDGKIVLYRQANGTWGTPVHRTNPLKIKGLRLNVTSINKVGAYFNLIELSGRLESDLTADVISYDSTFSMSEPNFITPLGVASSNMGNITLSNHDDKYNNDNVDSLYYGLIGRNVKFTLDLIYDLTSVGGTTEAVREFEMYSDLWAGNGEYESPISLKDQSKFLQEEKCPKMFLENMTVGEIIWRICDAIGFTGYSYDKNDLDPATLIPYFWADGEQTVWETFQGIATATQTAVYFDEFNTLRIQTRDVALNNATAVSWGLRAVAGAGARLPDIVDTEVTGDFEANTIDINYKTTKVSDDNNGFPAMEVVWQPEGDFVLRSSQITQTMTDTTDFIPITAGETEVWPYEGFVNIEGEVIEYKGKEYSYYEKRSLWPVGYSQANTSRIVTAYIFSLDEKKNIDKNLSDEDLSFKNSFTGKLKVVKRGAWWTSPKHHYNTLTGYSGRRFTQNLTAVENFSGCFQHVREQSLVKVITPSNFGPGNFYVATRGLTSDPAYAMYGTRMRIPTAQQGRGASGLVINSGTNDSGYFIEVIRTSILTDQAGAGRNAHHEINFYVRYTDGTIKRFGDDGGKGVPLLIAEDVFNDLDVNFYDDAGTHRVAIFVNGVKRMSVALTGANKLTSNGRFGFFARGYNNTEHEYLYAIKGVEKTVFDDSTYLDKIRGGFASSQFTNGFLYANRNTYSNSNATKTSYGQYFLDEFGPIVHELRMMDIDYEKSPVLHSRLYMTNDYQIVCPEFNSDAFGAQFLLANASRDNAVANGEDTLTFGSEDAVTHQMLIYGRVVFQEEDETHTIKNQDSINTNGIVQVEIDNPWIQSKAEAESLGTWITEHWAGSSDQLTIECFGNPLFQLGDKVSVHDPKNDRDESTHHYFIVEINNQFSTGLTTSLVLQRAKI